MSAHTTTCTTFCLTSELYDTVKFDSLVCLGLGSRAISYLESNISGVLGVPHTSLCDGATLNVDDLRESSQPLLLSDVVCTGQTASAVADRLTRAGKRPVGLFVLLALKNSARELSDGLPVWHAARINRDYYSPKCPLCDVDYPETVIGSVYDFHVTPEEATPYDFWELCAETHALKCSHRVVSSKHYTYYISTVSILAAHGDWISRCLLAKLRRSRSWRRASLLLCPDEPAALDLAYRMAVDLQLPVLPLSHRVLRAGGETLVRTDRLHDRIAGRHVIFVDDGCNTLSTYHGVRELLEACGGRLANFVVFLNRLAREGQDSLKQELDDSFVYFYRWPHPPLTAPNCVECAAQSREAKRV